GVTTLAPAGRLTNAVPTRGAPTGPRGAKAGPRTTAGPPPKAGPRAIGAPRPKAGPALTGPCDITGPRPPPIIPPPPIRALARGTTRATAPSSATESSRFILTSVAP